MGVTITTNRARSQGGELCKLRRAPTSGPTVAAETIAGVSILEGIDEFSGQQAGFLGQVLRAGPVAVLAGIARLRKEAANLSDEILLGGVQLLAADLLQVLLGRGRVFPGFAFIARLVARRELGRNLRSGRVSGLLRLGFRWWLLTGLAARRHGFRSRNCHRRGRRSRRSRQSAEELQRFRSAGTHPYRARCSWAAPLPRAPEQPLRAPRREHSCARIHPTPIEIPQASRARSIRVVDGSAGHLSFFRRDRTAHLAAFPAGASTNRASGSFSRNVVPRPVSDSNSIRPLCSCTNRNVFASPMPVPPGRVVKKSWKIFFWSAGGIPLPGVLHGNHREFAAATQAERDSARRGR